MKFNLKAALVLVAGCSLYASAANATTFNIQAGAGHPHQGSGNFDWAGEWTPANTWRIIDGRSIASVSGNGAWDTPVPITSTNTSWNVVAFGVNTAAIVNNRICSFDSAGNFFSCGASVALFGTSSTFVPPDGTMYSQSFWTCSGGSCGGATLFHVRATG